MDIDDYYCLKIERYGPLGVPAPARHEHVLLAAQAQALGLVSMQTLGRCERVVLTLTRGRQGEAAAQALADEDDA